MFTSGRKESLYPHMFRSWLWRNGPAHNFQPCTRTCFAPGFGEMHFADGFGEMHATSPPMQNEPSPFERDLDGELVCKTNPI